VLRIKTEGAESVRTAASMVYSQPLSARKVQLAAKAGQETPVPQLFSITEGMKSQTKEFTPASGGSKSARDREPRPLTCIDAGEVDYSWIRGDEVGRTGSARSSTRGSQCSSPGNGCKWSTVAKLNALKGEQEAQAKLDAIKSKRAELKRYLDGQVEAKTVFAVHKQEETVMLRTRVDNDFQRLQDEEAQKKIRFQEKVAVLKTDRYDQVVTARTLHAQEKQETLESGKALARQANYALKTEQEAALAKKDKEKKMMSSLIVLWAEEKEHHVIAQKEQEKKEKALSVALQNELLAEEEVKQAVIRVKKEKRDLEFAHLAAEEANAKQLKKMKRDARIKAEEADLEVVRAMNEESAERDRQKAILKKANRVKNVEFLFEQIGVRQAREQVEAEQKKDLLTNAKIAIEDNLKAEKQKSDSRRGKNVQHRLELEAQIESRKKAPARVREDLMSTAEAFLNKKVVAEAVKLGL